MRAQVGTATGSPEDNLEVSFERLCEELSHTLSYLRALRAEADVLAREHDRIRRVQAEEAWHQDDSNAYAPPR